MTGLVGKHGVCAYVIKDIMVDNVSCPAEDTLLFRLAPHDVDFLCVYRPPSNDA